MSTSEINIGNKVMLGMWSEMAKSKKQLISEIEDVFKKQIKQEKKRQNKVRNMLKDFSAKTLRESLSEEEMDLYLID